MCFDTKDFVNVNKRLEATSTISNTYQVIRFIIYIWIFLIPLIWIDEWHTLGYILSKQSEQFVSENTTSADTIGDLLQVSKKTRIWA